MTREMIAGVVLVWLVGALVGWCVGWAARGEQNRLWRTARASQLTTTRLQLSEALAELAELGARWEQAHRVTPPTGPAVVHVHVAAPAPPALDRTSPAVVDALRVLDPAVSALSAGRVVS